MHVCRSTAYRIISRASLRTQLAEDDHTHSTLPTNTRLGTLAQQRALHLSLKPEASPHLTDIPTAIPPENEPRSRNTVSTSMQNRSQTGSDSKSVSQTRSEPQNGTHGESHSMSTGGRRRSVIVQDNQTSDHSKTSLM